MNPRGIGGQIKSACLQLRKVLELIAFGSLVANAETYASVCSKVSKAWQAGALLKELAKVNPEFYPVPVVQVPSEVPGVLHQLKKRNPDYLAKDDFAEVYGRCGLMAHAANPYGKYRLRILRQNAIDLADSDHKSPEQS